MLQNKQKLDKLQAKIVANKEKKRNIQLQEIINEKLKEQEDKAKFLRHRIYVKEQLIAYKQELELNEYYQDKSL